MHHVCVTCSVSKFSKPGLGMFISGVQVHPQHILVKFVYQRHQVKVRVKVMSKKCLCILFMGALHSIERQSYSALLVFSIQHLLQTHITECMSIRV